VSFLSCRAPARRREERGARNVHCRRPSGGRARWG
jgi:hypothetical protein